MNPQDSNKTMQMLPPMAESQLMHSTMFPGPVQVAAPAAGAGRSSTPTLGGLMQALRRRWLLALSAAVAGAVLGVAAVLLALPVRYTAAAAVHVDSSKWIPVLNGAQKPEDVEFAILKGSMAARIKSPMVLKAALDSPQVVGLGLSENRAGLVKWLESSLKTDFLLGPEVLRITLSGDDPQEVAALCNAVIESFLNENKQKDKERLQSTLNALDESRSKTENILRQKKALFSKVLTEANLPDPDTQKQNYYDAMQRVNTYKKDLLIAEIDVSQAQEELKNLGEKEKNLPSIAIPEFLMNPEYEKLQDDLLFAKQVADQLLEYNKLLEITTKPQILQGKLAQIERTKGERQKMRERLRPEIEKRYRAHAADLIQIDIGKAQEKLVNCKRKYDALDSAVKNSEEDVRRLNPAKMRWPAYVEAMHEEIDGLKVTLGKLRETYEIVSADPPAPSRVKEWFRAEVPSGMDTGRQVKFGGAVGVGLFCIGLFGVGFLEFRSGRINGAEEVSRGLGMRVLGTLPPIPARARQGLLNGDEEARGESLWQNRLSESVDAIRTSIMHAARSENVRIIMVTSPGVGEGKTSLATQLAASLARAWKNTLLIDGDLRHPATHNLFEQSLEPGFSEVLRGEVAVADAIKPTALGRLWLMPAGHWDSHAVQALAQDNVKSLFESLKQQYEFIIVDSSPVLPVADTLSLGQNVDAVIYAVLRDVSRFPALQSAQHRLAGLDVRTLGAVLIGVNHDSADRSYQYTMSRERK